MGQDPGLLEFHHYSEGLGLQSRAVRHDLSRWDIDQNWDTCIQPDQFPASLEPRKLKDGTSDDGVCCLAEARERGDEGACGFECMWAAPA